MKQLTFTPDGTYLLHTCPEGIVAWDVQAGKQQYEQTGAFIGLSRDGKTFLTHQPPDSFCLWETATGARLQLDQIQPADFDFYQRVRIIADIRGLSLQVIDVFGEQTFPPIRVPHNPEEASLENWAVAPDNQRVAVIIGGSAVGFDWSQGFCFTLATGKLLYRFKASNQLMPAPLFFSVEHGLLLTGDLGCFNLYELASGALRRTVRFRSSNPYISAVSGSVVDVHPHTRRLVAVKANIPERYPERGVQILNLAKANAAMVEQTFLEPAPVVDIRFQPGGEYIAVLLNNGEIHLWELSTGSLIKVLAGNQAARPASVSIR